MSVSEHLSLSQVRAYVRGALHPSTLVGIDDHLEACAACRAALARESDASFGAEAFARALAAPEVRPESPHLGFEHLRGAVDGTLTPFDREWVDAHLALCAMCLEELRDLERFAVTLPARPKPKPEPVPASVSDDPALTAFTPTPPRAVYRDAYATARVLPPRVSAHGDAADEPPARYGEQPPAAMPWWIKAVAGLSLLALVQLWAC
jgi:anti-sigma factor RsiW